MRIQMGFGKRKHKDNINEVSEWAWEYDQRLKPTSKYKLGSVFEGNDELKYSCRIILRIMKTEHRMWCELKFDADETILTRA